MDGKTGLASATYRVLSGVSPTQCPAFNDALLGRCIPKHPLGVVVPVWHTSPRDGRMAEISVQSLLSRLSDSLYAQEEGMQLLYSKHFDPVLQRIAAGGLPESQPAWSQPKVVPRQLSSRCFNLTSPRIFPAIGGCMDMQCLPINRISGDTDVSVATIQVPISMSKTLSVSPS